jgi:hypothetical protein
MSPRLARLFFAQSDHASAEAAGDCSGRVGGARRARRRTPAYLSGAVVRAGTGRALESSGARAARRSVGRLLPPRERERRVSWWTPLGSRGDRNAEPDSCTSNDMAKNRPKSATNSGAEHALPPRTEPVVVELALARLVGEVGWSRSCSRSFVPRSVRLSRAFGAGPSE